MPSTRLTPTVHDTERPRLAPHVRLTFDRTRERHVLLSPETVVVLNPTGAAIVDLCDGERTVATIVAELHRRSARVVEDDVRRFIGGLVARRCLVVHHG